MKIETYVCDICGCEISNMKGTRCLNERYKLMLKGKLDLSGDCVNLDVCGDCAGKIVYHIGALIDENKAKDSEEGEG